MTLEQLAQVLGLSPLYSSDLALAAEQRVRVIDRVSSMAQASQSSLVFAETYEAVPGEGCNAAAMLAPLGAIQSIEVIRATGQPRGPVIVGSAQPRLDFARAALLLRRRSVKPGIHPQAWVAPDAQLGANVSVGAFAVLEPGAVIGDGTEIASGAVVGEGVVIGADCRVYPRVVLYPGTRLGDRVVVHAGAVLGADGFGYVRDRNTGAYTQFPQQGVLVIEDDVEIGANTTVDRGALEETRIARGTKLDNLVHIGHNVQVGADVVIAAQTGISGSSTIGAGAIIAGQVGIADHVEIGPGAILGAQCGVPSRKRISGPGTLFWGTPARPITQYLKELATLARLTRARRDPGKSGAGEGK
jgi:UDP-3-O-[3-hydroxymyristoyl] glucosamine N-acyltransferase